MLTTGIHPGMDLLKGLGKSLFEKQNFHEEAAREKPLDQQMLRQAHQLMEKQLNQALKAHDLGSVDETQLEATSNQDDFSPAAVTDRIMGFISGRLQAEKEAGASEERLQNLYNEAVSGLEQGFKEAKDIIESHGLLNGEVQDNFLQTISMVQEEMETLREDLFGIPPTEGDQPVPVPAAEAGSTSRVEAYSESAFYQQTRTFDMQVKTRDGDVVTLRVNAGEQADYQSSALRSSDVQGEAFAASYQNYSNISFSVEGELDEEEMAALNDLFGQVNDVAEVFYSGNVGEAFNKALEVGYDASELAGFAVHMTRSEVVAVKQAYTAVQEQPALAGSQGNASDGLFDTLVDFAGRVKQAKDNLEKLPTGVLDQKPIFAEALAHLMPDEEKNAGAHEANPMADSDEHQPWRTFVERLLDQ